MLCYSAYFLTLAVPAAEMFPTGHFCPLVHMGLSHIMELLPLWLDYIAWLYRNLFPVSAQIVPYWWIPKWIPSAWIPGANFKTAFSVRTRAANLPMRTKVANLKLSFGWQLTWQQVLSPGTPPLLVVGVSIPDFFSRLLYKLCRHAVVLHAFGLRNHPIK